MLLRGQRLSEFLAKDGTEIHETNTILSKLFSGSFMHLKRLIGTSPMVPLVTHRDPRHNSLCLLPSGSNYNRGPEMYQFIQNPPAVTQTGRKQCSNLH